VQGGQELRAGARHAAVTEALLHHVAGQQLLQQPVPVGHRRPQGEGVATRVTGRGRGQQVGTQAQPDAAPVGQAALLRQQRDQPVEVGEPVDEAEVREIAPRVALPAMVEADGQQPALRQGAGEGHQGAVGLDLLRGEGRREQHRGPGRARRVVQGDPERGPPDIGAADLLAGAGGGGGRAHSSLAARRRRT